MEENVFKVDLGNLRLDKQQRDAIAMAIQQAVINQLADFSPTSKVVFTPLSSWEDPRITNGLMARELAEQEF